MVLYCNSDGAKLYSLYGDATKTGSVPLGNLFLAPGFNLVDDEKYAKFAPQLDGDPKIFLNAEKRKYGTSMRVLDGWYYELPVNDADQARTIWGPSPIPIGHGLVDSVQCFKMDAGDGTHTRLHGCIYLLPYDTRVRIAVGGKIVAIGSESGESGLICSWSLEVAPKEWLNLCQSFPIVWK